MYILFLWLYYLLVFNLEKEGRMTYSKNNTAIWENGKMHSETEVTFFRISKIRKKTQYSRKIS